MEEEVTQGVPVLSGGVFEGDGRHLANAHIQAVLHSHSKQVYQLSWDMLELQIIHTRDGQLR